MKVRIGPLVLALSLMSCKVSETQLFHHGSSSLAPDPAPQASDLSADQLIAKYAAARGGEQKLKSLQTVTMTGQWSSKNSVSPVTVMIAPGRYVRRIAQGSRVTMINAVDGPTAWQMNPRNGIVKPTPMAAKEASRFRRLADPSGPLFDAKAKGHKVEVVGKMPWHNSPVYKIKLTFGDGEVTYYYLDAKSFLPVRVMGSQYVPQLDKNIDIEVVYTDFRDVDGVKWPFKEEANAPEVNFEQTISWEKIALNKPLDDSAFKAPKS